MTELYQLDKTDKDVRDTVLTNCVKMLTERGILNKDELNKNIDSVLKMDNSSYIYTVGTKDSKFTIKIVDQKVTSVSKASEIGDFLSKHKNDNKIIIVKDISKKALENAVTNFLNTEIFLEKELMINIVDHIFVPKHRILTKEETDKFYEEYSLKRSQIPKILKSDPVARYYNMKPKDICEILRPNSVSGYSVSYRLVVNK